MCNYIDLRKQSLYSLASRKSNEEVFFDVRKQDQKPWFENMKRGTQGVGGGGLGINGLKWGMGSVHEVHGQVWIHPCIHAISVLPLKIPWGDTKAKCNAHIRLGTCLLLRSNENLGT